MTWACTWAGYWGRCGHEQGDGKEDGHTVTFMHHITYIRGTKNSALEKKKVY